MDLLDPELPPGFLDLMFEHLEAKLERERQRE
jgi:hypothetical protein